MTEQVATGWEAYFSACESGNLPHVFDCMVAIGLRPVPIVADSKTGKVKIPQGGGWGVATIEDRRYRLEKLIKTGDPVGLGCQADGYVVLDIDPPNKDRKQLGKAWKDAAAILLGGEDWPETLVVATEAGCHVWFRTTPTIESLWTTQGKQYLDLPGGGRVEFFTGNSAQMQVACPPSKGKGIAMAREPIAIPSAAEEALLEILKPTPAPKREYQPVPKAGTGDFFAEKMDNQHRKILDAEEGARHDTYRKACRLMGGYAAGMGLTDLKDSVFLAFSSAHRDSKPEVSDYVLTETFEWGWARGVASPLYSPTVEADLPPPVCEGEATNADDIRGLMTKRSWIWGDPVTNAGWFVQRGLHLVEGKEGTGKTRWIMDLVRRWSLGLKWPDGSDMQMDAESKVLFVASDSHWDQIAMCAEAFNIPGENVIFTGPKTDPYNYTSIDDPATLAYIRLWCDKYKIGMVVVDTLMAASTKPLVDPQEVAKIATPLRQLARDFNVPIVLVGHLNSQGETWGRSMGRTCDHVIRLEADVTGQRISIKSVKARWNKSALPELIGVQAEGGWAYGDEIPEGAPVGAPTDMPALEQAVYLFLSKHGPTTFSEIKGAMLSQGFDCPKTSLFRTVKAMVDAKILIGQDIVKDNGTGSFPGYDIHP